VDSSQRALLQLQQSLAATSTVVGALVFPRFPFNSSSRTALHCRPRTHHRLPQSSTFSAARITARGVLAIGSSFRTGGTTWSTSMLFTQRRS
jgi:hypothetical protein